MNSLKSAAAHSPLEGTHLKVAISDLIAEHQLTFSFKNTYEASIEAVFTFPVPLDAAFLGMTATLNDKTLVAEISARNVATTRYDEAISEGDSAVLLEVVEQGLWCLNLGNLAKGESAAVELRFATEVATAGSHARFSLPLVYRPRYGRWDADEINEPENDFAVENPLTADIEIRGLLAGAPVTCSSHMSRFEQLPDVTKLHLPAASLDRDLVLNFEVAQSQAAVRRVSGANEKVWMATMMVPYGADSETPVDACLLIDCSGSMVGDAIAQARDATRAFARELKDEDTVQVIQFGTTHKPMFRRAMPATSRVRQTLGALANLVDASMGGTEISDALIAAIESVSRNKQDARSRVVILVTDGAVQPCELEEPLAMAKKHGVRIFVVAVGSSANAEVLQVLSRGSDSVLERAVPAEPIDACVLRQFKRARQVRSARIEMAVGDERQTVSLAPKYAGDGVTLFVSADACPSFYVDGHPVALAEGAQMAGPEAKAALTIYGQQLYAGSDADAREAVALRFGLLSKETSAVLVQARAEGEKLDGMPVIVKVRHEVPAGMVAMAERLDIRSSYAPSGRTYFMRAPAQKKIGRHRSAAEALYHSLPPVPSAPIEPVILSVAETQAAINFIHEELKRNFLANAFLRLDKYRLIVHAPSELRRCLLSVFEALETQWNEKRDDAIISLLSLMNQALSGQLANPLTPAQMSDLQAIREMLPSTEMDENDLIAHLNEIWVHGVPEI